MKWILGFVIGAIAIAGAFLLPDLQIFRHSLSAFYSKSFCSCFFVMQQNEDVCHEYAQQYLPIQQFRLDKEHQNVWVKALGVEAVASFEGPKKGCLLQSFQ